MISAPPHARILVASKPVDFRKGLPGLSALVETVLQENPFAGDVFIFRSKRADRVKILVWDGTGTCGCITNASKPAVFFGRRRRKV